MIFSDSMNENYIKSTFNLSSENPIQVRIDMFEDDRVSTFDMHYMLELGIVYSGKMIRKYQSFNLELNPGEMWISGIWEPHGFKLIEVPCQVLVFIISPEFIGNLDQPGFNWLDLFSMPVEKRMQVSENHRSEIFNICKKVMHLQSNEQKTDILWKKILLIELLLYYSESNAPTLLSIKGDATKNYLSIQPSLQLVFNSKKLIMVEDAAKMCKMSLSCFSKAFMGLMGISFSKFALSFRIKEAARQITNSDDSIKAIAIEWGFTDPSHFHSCFTKYFSVSPKEYRKRRKA